MDMEVMFCWHESNWPEWQIDAFTAFFGQGGSGMPSFQGLTQLIFGIHKEHL